MALLTVQRLLATGLTPVLVAAAAGGDTFRLQSGERTFVVVRNGSGASINVTLAAVQTLVQVRGVGPVTLASRVRAIPAGQDAWLGELTQAFANNAGLGSLTYSAVASVTVGVFRVASA